MRISDLHSGLPGPACIISKGSAAAPVDLDSTQGTGLIPVFHASTATHRGQEKPPHGSTYRPSRYDGDPHVAQCPSPQHPGRYQRDWGR